MASGSDTQGFDGSAIRTATQYDAQGHVAQKSDSSQIRGGAFQMVDWNGDG
jgi:hypothetical protein